MKDKPLVSVITVCYNSEKHIRKTIESVLMQTYKNIEYIIIDGKSKDKTLEIIKGYEPKFKGKMRLISEEDDGIYDAMNKGVGIATGEWINFMNAGDGFYGYNTIEKIFSGNIYKADFIFGDHIVEYNSNFSIIKKAGEIKDLWRKNIFSHQTLFSRNYIFKKYKFNINNKIVSDFEFIANCYMDKFAFYNVHFPIAVISAGGLSDKDRIKSILERWLVVRKFSNSAKNNILYCMLFCKVFIKLCIIKMLPKEIYFFLLKKKYRRLIK